MQNAAIIHYALFWNRNNGLQCAYFVNNGLQDASINRRFWMSYIKWYKFYNNNLLVVLGSTRGATWKLVNPNERRLNVNSIADSLSLNVLVYFVEMSSYFSMKANKRKVWKCLKCVNEFSRRFDLANGKYLSIFLEVFARIVKITHFAQVINVHERAYGKIHLHKVDKKLDVKFIYINVLILKCVSITNISIEHYIEGVIR